MAKKKKKQLLPWCWYCEREFEDDKVLIQHQRAKHYKCPHCNKRLNTAGGLQIHVAQVHKANIDKVPNSLPVKEAMDIEIFGMEGIPEYALLERAHQHSESLRKEREAKKFSSSSSATCLKRSFSATDSPDPLSASSPQNLNSSSLLDHDKRTKLSSNVTNSSYNTNSNNIDTFSIRAQLNAHRVALHSSSLPVNPVIASAPAMHSSSPSPYNNIPPSTNPSPSSISSPFPPPPLFYQNPSISPFPNNHSAPSPIWPPPPPFSNLPFPSQDPSTLHYSPPPNSLIPERSFTSPPNHPSQPPLINPSSPLPHNAPLPPSPSTSSSAPPVPDNIIKQVSAPVPASNSSDTATQSPAPPQKASFTLIYSDLLFSVEEKRALLSKYIISS